MVWWQSCIYCAQTINALLSVDFVFSFPAIRYNPNQNVLHSVPSITYKNLWRTCFVISSLQNTEQDIKAWNKPTQEVMEDPHICHTDFYLKNGWGKQKSYLFLSQKMSFPAMTYHMAEKIFFFNPSLWNKVGSENWLKSLLTKITRWWHSVFTVANNQLLNCSIGNQSRGVKVCLLSRRWINCSCS